MIDGEGCVYFHPKNRDRWIVISNTDLDIIAACIECLAILGIEYRIYTEKARGNQKECKVIQIGRQKDLLLVFDLVPLRCGRKKEKLQSILLSYVQRTPATTTLRTDSLRRK